MLSATTEKIMYNYPCEYCDGTVRPKRVNREASKHRDGFVIMKDITIGVCDKCGNRYYSADILRRVEAIASGQVPADAEERVLVGHLA
jgi:YgiT-type zinc finger domain-containing protein